MDRSHELLQILSERLGIEVVDLLWFESQPGLRDVVPSDLVRKTRLIPLEKAGTTLRVATADPYNITAFDDLREHTGLLIEPLLADAGQIQRIIQKHFAA